MFFKRENFKGGFWKTIFSVNMVCRKFAQSKIVQIFLWHIHTLIYTYLFVQLTRNEDIWPKLFNEKTFNPKDNRSIYTRKLNFWTKMNKFLSFYWTFSIYLVHFAHKCLSIIMLRRMYNILIKIECEIAGVLVKILISVQNKYKKKGCRLMDCSLF